jgi:hypothetical protein
MSDNKHPRIPETPHPHERPSTPTPPASRVPAPSERGEGSTPPDTRNAPLPAHRAGYRVPSGHGGGWGEDGWREALPAIADRLREIGYDIPSSQSSAPPGGSIVARRDLGDRAVVLAIDAGGRFRAELTWVVGEWPSQDEIAGVRVRVIDAVSRAVTVTGQLPGPEQVVDVVTGLGTIASWADVTDPEASPPST